MQTITLELDNFINPAVGAEVSFHSISWNREHKQTSIPSGGNLHYHSLPSGGTVPHTHEFGELIFILSRAPYPDFIQNSLQYSTFSRFFQ